MKEMTNYQRTANYLVKIFRAVNSEYFDNELDTPTITIQSTVGAYGHVTTSKVWTNGDNASYELNVGAEWLNRPIENVVATLIHECVHLYCLQNNIKDTSNRGVYHNKRFKEIAETKGHLTIERHERYGWTITSPTEDTLNFCISYGFDDIKIGRNSFTGLAPITGGKNGNGNTTTGTTPKVRKPSSTRKYICPCCGNSFRATKNINVLCMDCNEQFVLAD